MQNRSQTHHTILLPLPLTTKFLALICCDQSAVAMRLGARLPSAKLTLSPGLAPQVGATNRVYLFWTEFFFMADKCPEPMYRNGQS